MSLVRCDGFSQLCNFDPLAAHSARDFALVAVHDGFCSFQYGHRFPGVGRLQSTAPQGASVNRTSAWLAHRLGVGAVLADSAELYLVGVELHAITNFPNAFATASSSLYASTTA